MDSKSSNSQLEQETALILEAVDAMMAGKFSVPLSIESDSAMGSVASSLKLLAAHVEEKIRESSLLLQMIEKANSGLLLDEVLNYVYDSFQASIPYDRIGFSLIEQDGAVVSRWARSTASEVFIDVGYRGVLKGSSLESIVDTGEPRIINDLEVYLKRNPASQVTRAIVREGMLSSLTCPLIAHGRSIGFIFFSSMSRGTYQDAHVHFFTAIANQLSLIAEKSILYQRLLELNEVKDKFLGIAAHDLRNPLFVLQSYLEMLLKEVLGEVNEQQRSAISVMLKKTSRMFALIEDLLDVSAIAAGKLSVNKQLVELTELIIESNQLAVSLCKVKSIKLVWELQDEIPKIEVDPERFTQILSNLLSNVIKFSHPNTTIKVQAKLVDAALAVSVCDQGIGIPENEIPKLFSDFCKLSVKPTAGEASTGLGLSIVRRLVEGHGGTLRVISRVGVGSTFTFTLPLGENFSNKAASS